MLIETEEQAALWDQQSAHTDVDGDPLGDNKIEYRNESGKSIVLKLKTASSVAGGILDQYDLGPYNLIILGSTEGQGNFVKSFWDPAVAERLQCMHPVPFAFPEIWKPATANFYVRTVLSVLWTWWQKHPISQKGTGQRSP